MAGYSSATGDLRGRERIAWSRSMGGPSRPPMVSVRGVPLQRLWHEPLREGVPGGRPGPARPRRARLGGGGPGGGRVAEVEEDDRLVLGKHLLEPAVVLRALLLVAGAAPLLEQPVHLRGGVGDEVELVGARLGRVPDVVLVGG